MILPLAFEKIWFEKTYYDEAEAFYVQQQSKQAHLKQESLASQIEKARENIQSTLAGSQTVECSASKTTILNACDRLANLEIKQEFLTISLKAMQDSLAEITNEIKSLSAEKFPTKVVAETSNAAVVAVPLKAKCPDESDSDEVDLFGSNESGEEDEEYARVREERLKAYADKKSKKPGPIAKSSVLLDVKPWDDETDMTAMEITIRKIEMDGLRWGAGKLVPLAFGIKKLSILCVVEDEKVSIDDLSEKIEEFEDLVQSVDIAAFNKI